MNVTYSGLGRVPSSRGHNWILHKAIEWLENYRPGPNISWSPPELNENLVHYGLAYADSPWLGPPETFDSADARLINGASMASVRADLYGTTVDEDKATTVGCAALYPRSSDSRPNLFLQSKWVWLEHVEAFATDNISHYPHNTKLRADGTMDSEAVMAEGPEGSGSWRIKGAQYGLELFKLARSFWSENAPAPSLSRLVHIPRAGQMSNQAWISLEDYAHVEIGETYLGGNPFIVTKGGEPTWPIWVAEPEDLSVRQLVDPTPRRSERVAAIYLGWASHLLHDLAHPYHAKNRAGKYHRQSEDNLDKWISEGRFDHLPVINVDLLGVGEGKKEYRYSDRPVYKDDLWFQLVSGLACSEINRRFLFRDSASMSIHASGSDLNSATDLESYELILDRTIKDTATLLYWLSAPEEEEEAIHIRGKVTSEGYPVREIMVFANDPILGEHAKATTDKSGNYVMTVLGGHYQLSVGGNQLRRFSLPPERRPWIKAREDVVCDLHLVETEIQEDPRHPTP